MSTNPSAPYDAARLKLQASKAEAPAMFNRIASRYDLLNRLLSASIDQQWRLAVAKTVRNKPAARALDLATGTADQLLALAEAGVIREGVGLDPAEQMLQIGREKIGRRTSGSRLTLQTGSAEAIPFPDQSFDLLTMSFGIRNVADLEQSLGEMVRVLRPGGQVILLEFSIPTSRIIRTLYLAYFRHLLPRIGGFLSGDRAAYRYLNQTVEAFPYGEAFVRLLTDAGFHTVQAVPKTFGIATIYSGFRT